MRAWAGENFRSGPAISKPINSVPFGFKPACGMLEPDAQAIAFRGRLPVQGAGVLDPLAVRDGPGPERQPQGDILFIGGVDVLGHSDVDGHRHAGVGQGQGLALRVPDLRPHALRRGLEVGELYNEEGEAALPPRARPSQFVVCLGGACGPRNFMKKGSI
jgi:hypothetical protein